MIHQFLRESKQLNLKVTPDYNRFKWMAANIFRYVWRERAAARVAESAAQDVCKRAEKGAAKSIAMTVFELLLKQQED
jgi:hypothetical protein